MKEPSKDDERLSALLEGRVSGREREELLAHLAASEDDYEVFTDTADVLRILEEEDARAAAASTPGVIPIGRGRGGWGSPVRRLAAAAAVVGVLLVSALVLRQRGAGAGEPVRLAALADPAGQGLPEGWTGLQRWTSARGEDESAAAAARAARAGALLVDLSVAVAAGDPADTQLLADQLRAREPVAAGALGEIAARAGTDPGTLLPRVEQVADRLADRLGREHLALGAWAEAARLAANRRDQAFFRAIDSRGMLRRAERLTGDDAPAQAAIARIRAALPADGPPQWEPLQAAADALLREIAG